MFKFFRKIRQNLINEGKTTRYFKYAIGEIILVVIGILIALSINSWYQLRIDRINENKYLQAIVSEIKSNISLNQDLVISRMDRKLKSLKLAKSYAEGKLEVENPVDLINNIGYGGVFSGGYFMGDKNIYAELISTGNLSLILDFKIKKAIIDYYSSIEGRRDRSIVHASRYSNYTSSIRPFDTKFPNELSQYDQTEAMEAFKSKEFRKLVDLELAYAYKVRDYVTDLNKQALKLIDLIDTKSKTSEPTHD